MSAHNEQSEFGTMQRNGGRVFHVSTSAPAGSEAGFMAGAWWVYANGASSTIYVNVGTVASATWKYASIEA